MRAVPREMEKGVLKPLGLQGHRDLRGRSVKGQRGRTCPERWGRGRLEGKWAVGTEGTQPRRDRTEDPWEPLGK